MIFVEAVKGLLVDLPRPKKIRYMWNFGFILGLYLFFQIVSGLFLTFYYVGGLELAFNSVDLLVRDVADGWFIRSFHAKGASVYFLCLYIHMFRGVYYQSYFLRSVWLVGCVIFILSMAVAFLGYVLPWGNMSFWGATVITNFFSAIPYFGKEVVVWLWGGFSVGGPTLTRFFSLHFLLPFVILLFVVIHVIFLHEVGRKKPLGISSFGDKVKFHPYFSYKDVLGFFILFVFFFVLVLGFPYYFSDSEKFLEANLLVTPVHIQPEWYFLAAYAVLRSIPKKLGGVVVLLLFILIFFFLPFMRERKIRGSQFFILFQILFFFWVVNVFLLTLVGGRPIEVPFLNLGRFFSIFYFVYFFDLFVVIFNYSKKVIRYIFI